MTAFALKLIAIITMTIDHVGFLFFPESLTLRIIGRISFPIFAFLIAEGFIKTSSVKKYLGRLTIFALISQIPFGYFESFGGNVGFHLNILFTLALGVLILALVNQTKKTFLKILIILGGAALAHFGSFSYGAYGIFSILGSYLFLAKNRKQGLVALSVLPFLETVRLFLEKIFFLQFFAILSLIPIYLYNGEHGARLSKWVFYCFYPLHMIILSLIFVVWF